MADQDYGIKDGSCTCFEHNSGNTCYGCPECLRAWGISIAVPFSEEQKHTLQSMLEAKLELSGESSAWTGTDQKWTSLSEDTRNRILPLWLVAILSQSRRLLLPEDMPFVQSLADHDGATYCSLCLQGLNTDGAANPHFGDLSSQQECRQQQQLLLNHLLQLLEDKPGPCCTGEKDCAKAASAQTGLEQYLGHLNSILEGIEKS